MVRSPKSNLDARCTLETRRTSMISGKSFKLFVISTIITHKETVILIEPPRKEAAPRRAYLENKMPDQMEVEQFRKHQI